MRSIPRAAPRRTGAWLACTVALVASGLAGRAAADDARPEATAQVDIARFAFAPKEVTVAPGTTVVWTNHDLVSHSVSSRDQSFASKGLGRNDTYQSTFTAEGDFPYVCTVHPFMTGVVHVRKPG